MPHPSDVAVYLLLLPIFAVAATIGLGALSLLLRVRWVPAGARR